MATQPPPPEPIVPILPNDVPPFNTPEDEPSEPEGLPEILPDSDVPGSWPYETGAALIVWFGWPGGGYNRHHFDRQLPSRTGYSEADYQAAQVSIFVAMSSSALAIRHCPICFRRR